MFFSSQTKTLSRLTDRVGKEEGGGMKTKRGKRREDRQTESGQKNIGIENASRKKRE